MTHEASMTGRGRSSDIVAALGAQRVVPVVTIDDALDAPALVTALAAGGLSVVEITMRTPVAVEAIRRAASEVRNVVVGAGSVTSTAAAVAAIDAGAEFIVSPGLDEGVIGTAIDHGVAVIPGIATPTELMRAMALGIDLVKLFPAEVVGGLTMISALSAVWPNVQFMPTGGVSPTNARDYLAHRQVLAVGGSWMVSQAALAARDWASISVAAAAAVAGLEPAGEPS